MVGGEVTVKVDFFQDQKIFGDSKTRGPSQKRGDGGACGGGRQEGGTRENSAAGSTVDVSEETPTHQLLHGEKIVAYARKQPTPTAYHGVSAVSGAEQVLLVSIVDADAPIPFVDENRKMRRCFNVDTDKCGNVSVGAFTKEYLNDGGKLTPAPVWWGTESIVPCHGPAAAPGQSGLEGRTPAAATASHEEQAATSSSAPSSEAPKAPAARKTCPWASCRVRVPPHLGRPGERPSEEARSRAPRHPPRHQQPKLRQGLYPQAAAADAARAQGQHQQGASSAGAANLYLYLNLPRTCQGPTQNLPRTCPPPKACPEAT